MRTSMLFVLLCFGAATSHAASAGSSASRGADAAPAKSTREKLRGIVRSAAIRADRLLAYRNKAGRTYLKAFDVEQSAQAEAALRAHYKLEAKVQRNVWTESLDLETNKSPAVSSSVTAGLGKPVQIITNVHDLLGSNVEQRLRALGFEGRLDTRQGLANARLEMSLRAPDPEVQSRLGYKGVQRTLQRVSVDYKDGQIERAYLISYSWPPAGTPGMNEENIHYEASRSEGAKVTRILLNSKLSRTVALPLGTNIDFSKRDK